MPSTGSQQPSSDVLVVDDDLVVRRVVSLMLERHGHVAVTAASAGQALEALEAFTPRLILVDLNLPDLSGFELLAAMRERLGRRMPPAVLLTANATPGLLASAASHGVVHAIAKPLDSGKVERLLLPLLGGRATPPEAVAAQA